MKPTPSPTSPRARSGADLSPRGLRSLASQLLRSGASRASHRRDRATGRRARAAVRRHRRKGRRGGRRAHRRARTVPASASPTPSASVPKDEVSTQAAQAVKLAGARRETLARMANPAEGDVVWVEGRRTMRIAPVDPGALMAKRLFTRRAVVLLSATMGAGERFEPLARRVGLDPEQSLAGGAKRPGLAYRSLRVASPFDLPRTGTAVRPPGASRAERPEVAGRGRRGGRRADRRGGRARPCALHVECGRAPDCPAPA